MSNFEDSVIICEPSPPRTRARLRSLLSTKANSKFNEYESPLVHFQNKGDKSCESLKKVTPLRRSTRHKRSLDSESVIILSDEEDDNQSAKKKNIRHSLRSVKNHANKNCSRASVIDLDISKDPSKDQPDGTGRVSSRLEATKKSPDIVPNPLRLDGLSLDESYSKRRARATASGNCSPKTRSQKHAQQIKETTCKPSPFKPDEITVVWSSEHASTSNENLSTEPGPSGCVTPVSKDKHLFTVDTNGNLSNFANVSTEKKRKARKSVGGKRSPKKRKSMRVRGADQPDENTKYAGRVIVKRRNKNRFGKRKLKNQLKNHIVNTKPRLGQSDNVDSVPCLEQHTAVDAVPCWEQNNIDGTAEMHAEWNKETNAGSVVSQTSSEASVVDGALQPKRRLREIIVDGSNVALAYTNNITFSETGIGLVINYFQKRGHVVKVFLSQGRRSWNRPRLEYWFKRGIVVFTPSRTAGNKVIRSYDDNFILEYATLREGIVISQDQYRDLYESRPEWRDTITNRLLPPTFVGDIVMFPRDPLGRNGPDLDEFLSHPNP